MINDMRIEASNYDDVEIIIKDAQNNNETQIQQIRDLIRQKVDVLIISPYQSEPITAVAEEAYRAGIPTIITDRKVNTDQYTSFVGANNYEIGLAAGNYAANYLPPNAIILEIWGLTQTSPAQERHKGFVDALREREDLSFRKIEGQWLVDTARMELQKLEHPEQIDFWHGIPSEDGSCGLSALMPWRVPVWKPWKMDGSMPLSSIRQEGSK